MGPSCHFGSRMCLDIWNEIALIRSISRVNSPSRRNLIPSLCFLGIWMPLHGCGSFYCWSSRVITPWRWSRPKSWTEVCVYLHVSPSPHLAGCSPCSWVLTHPQPGSPPPGPYLICHQYLPLTYGVLRTQRRAHLRVASHEIREHTLHRTEKNCVLERHDAISSEFSHSLPFERIKTAWIH